MSFLFSVICNLNFQIIIEGPGDILPNRETEGTLEINKKFTHLQENKKDTPNSIEEWEELQIRSDLDTLDIRKRPDYTISYKQDVKTEDLFLQVRHVV